VAGQQRELVYCALFGVTPGPSPMPTGKGLLSLVPSPTYSASAPEWQAGAVLTSSKPFAIASRRKFALGQAGIANYPALYLIEVGEEYTRQLMFGPPKVTFISHVQLESATGTDPNSVSASEINNLADVVEDAVEGPLPGTDNLGGLVMVSRINGREVVDVASGSGRWTIQILEVETIVTHGP